MRLSPLILIWFAFRSFSASVADYGAVGIRNVSDAEWTALTNRYTNFTNTVVFYSK